MKTLRLLSTTAAVLLLGAGAVSAQGMKNDEAPARAPAAQQNAPAEKVAPAMKPGEQKAGTKKAPDTIGQAPKASDSGKSQTMDKSAPAGAAADVKADAKGDVKSEATPKESEKSSENAGAKKRLPLRPSPPASKTVPPQVKAQRLAQRILRPNNAPRSPPSSSSTKWNRHV